MSSDTNANRRRRRATAIKHIGKLLREMKSRGIVMTPLRESCVSLSGWPDFFVSDTQGRVACLSVFIDAAEPDASASLFGGHEVSDGLTRLAGRLQEIRDDWHRAYPDSTAVISLVIVCPDQPAGKLRRNWPELTCGPVRILGKEAYDAAGLAAAMEALPQRSANEADITLLRAHLAPETVIAPSPSARRQHTRQHQLSLLPQLLDYDQDLCAKLDLWLPDEARQAVEESSIRLIKGAAGTGKSLVLVHRAALVRQLQPAARILVLTHNVALRGDLESRFQRMCGGGGVEFLTFYSWVGRHWPSDAAIHSGPERDGFIQSSAADVAFLRDEFDWLHDQGILTLDEYLTARRTGRTRALRESQRRAVFAAFLDCRRRQDEAGRTDWSRLACDALTSGRPTPRYDFILVDEAQFFARTWLRLVRGALRPGGQLFLCADPAQGFLGRGESWIHAGLEVRGRVHVLSRPYRNTRQILNFAAENYRRQVEGDTEAPALTKTEEALLRDGPEPAEIRVASPQEETAAVVAQVRDLINSGMAPRDILVLCTRRWQVDDLGLRLDALSIPRADLQAKADERDRCILIGTMDAATGIERPMVILCGLRELTNHEQNPAMPSEERVRHRRQNASRCYMACTRAMERLVIIRCGAESAR